LTKPELSAHDYGDMRLSSRGEYGLLALVDLATHAQDPAPSQAHQIAQRQGIPKQYLDQLMLSLKKSGLVASSRGREGGYRLARPASEITVLQIVTALDGPLKNSNFQQKGRRKLKARAVLREIWDDLWSRSAATLGAITLQDVCDRSKNEEEALMYYI
jgi:Rrf2 family transcriptional regulator, cysteine metabolism repressor